MPQPPPTARPDGPAWVRPAALVACVAWLEGVLRVATGSPLGPDALALPLLFGAAVALGLHLVSALPGRRGGRVVVGLALVLLTAGYAAQLVYFQVFRTFSSVYSAANAGQVAEFVPDIVAVVGENAAVLGTDAFSDAPPLVIFNNRSFITDRGRYHARTGEFVPVPGADVPEDYRRRVSADIDRRFHYSAVVLDTDYYALARPR